ncbi:unnamed protein product [Cuscuta campestris]|uniref:CCHC-type domain-containing protein n=1 Tax=Cuscuta campestris TaxID=132261 RepID=A0A484LH72_9ASTE|nr:unnamed protein product [Cuscuta campestris]
MVDCSIYIDPHSSTVIHPKETLLETIAEELVSSIGVDAVQITFNALVKAFWPSSEAEKNKELRFIKYYGCKRRLDEDEKMHLVDEEEEPFSYFCDYIRFWENTLRHWQDCSSYIDPHSSTVIHPKETLLETIAEELVSTISVDAVQITFNALVKAFWPSSGTGGKPLLLKKRKAGSPLVEKEVNLIDIFESVPHISQNSRNFHTIARHRVHRSLVAVAAEKTGTVDRLFITVEDIDRPDGSIFNRRCFDPICELCHLEYETARNGIHKGESSEASASVFAVKNKMDVKELVCTHCGKTGHEVEACYKLIGYPEGEMLDADGSSSSTSIDHFDDDDEVPEEGQLDRPTRNGRPEEGENAAGQPAVDQVDRSDVHGRPSSRQKDGSLGNQPTVDAVDRSETHGRPLDD